MQLSGEASLGWYPPSPGEAPASMLDRARDDWTMEAKIDGDRIVAIKDSEVHVFSHDGLLSKAKGRDEIKELLTLLPEGVCVDAEWVHEDNRGVPPKTLWLFDIPSLAELTYDQRRAALFDLCHHIGGEDYQTGRIRIVPQTLTDFRKFYEEWRGRAEGVVFKQRSSTYPLMDRKKKEVRCWLKRRYKFDRR